MIGKQQDGLAGVGFNLIEINLMEMPADGPEYIGVQYKAYNKVSFIADHSFASYTKSVLNLKSLNVPHSPGPSTLADGML